MREVAGCESCGALPGAPCVAYVKKPGKTTGKPTGDVHAARWRAFRAYLREQAQIRQMESGGWTYIGKDAGGGLLYTRKQQA